jgi:hypothetical protein
MLLLAGCRDVPQMFGRSEPVFLLQEQDVGDDYGSVWIATFEYLGKADCEKAAKERDIAIVRKFIAQVDELDDESKARTLKAYDYTPEDYLKLKQRIDNGTAAAAWTTAGVQCVPVDSMLAQVGVANRRFLEKSK